MYHLKRKHKIVCDTIDQYMAQGLVVFRGGQGAGGQQVANPEWRFFISRIFSKYFSGFSWIFPDFFPDFDNYYFELPEHEQKKNLPQIFSSQKTTKNNIIIMLLHTYLLKIVQKIWMKKEKRSCFDFFVMLRVISWSAIYLVSDCTVLHKIKRRKIVQALSPRIFLSTVDKIIGTKYICTKYVDRNYNIHLQNTTTLLPIIQELFFHVIIFFCPAQIKNIYCFSQKNIS